MIVAHTDQAAPPAQKAPCPVTGPVASCGGTVIASPVLFIVFNRPRTTRRVFEVIRAAAPTRLYVAADGPRPGRLDDIERCAEVRRIATAVDWPCQLMTRFQPTNVGMKIAESDAMNWFFDHEEEGIILEDDTFRFRGFSGSATRCSIATGMCRL